MVRGPEEQGKQQDGGYRERQVLFEGAHFFLQTEQWQRDSSSALLFLLSKNQIITPVQANIAKAMIPILTMKGRNGGVKRKACIPTQRVMGQQS